MLISRLAIETWKEASRILLQKRFDHEKRTLLCDVPVGSLFLLQADTATRSLRF